MNVKNRNVYKFNAALGRSHELVKMLGDVDNCGARHVEKGGYIPTFKIDDLALEACDLIYLDIEGVEVNAVLGGMTTINKYHPVIVFEENECCGWYQVSRGAVTDLLSGCGYRETHHWGNDIVLQWMA